MTRKIQVLKNYAVLHGTLGSRKVAIERRCLLPLQSWAGFALIMQLPVTIGLVDPSPEQGLGDSAIIIL
jgi:hypothetical protein